MNLTGECADTRHENARYDNATYATAGYADAACALLTCTRTGQLLRVNDTLLRWTGTPRDESPGQLFDLFTPASQLFFEMQLLPLLALGRDVEGAFLTLRHRDGSTLPVVVNAHRTGTDDISMALLIVRERERYEASLRQSHADAERALDAMSASAHAQKMQAVGRLAGGIAHEFNNLLAVVRGNITFAQQGAREAAPGDARLRDDLQVALDATDRTVAIVRQLLAFTGRQVVQRSVLDLNAVVVDAAQLLVPALGRDVTWQTHLADGLWPVFAASDQLHHVLASLVLNARDAVRASGSPGVVRISTENVAATGDRPDQVRLVVEDSGIGMDAETLAHAIDPFFTTKPVGQGTGLGLSMVYGTINALGGRTDIVSAPGDGTRVTLTIPRTAPSGRATPLP